MNEQKLTARYVVWNMTIKNGKVHHGYYEPIDRALEPLRDVGIADVLKTSYVQVPLTPEMLRMVHRLQKHGIEFLDFEKLIPTRLLRELSTSSSSRAAQLVQFYVPREESESESFEWNVTRFLQTYEPQNQDMCCWINDIVPRCRTLVPDVKRYFHSTGQTYDFSVLLICFQEPFFRYSLPASFRFKADATQQKFNLVATCRKQWEPMNETLHGLEKPIYLAVYHRATS
jgi:hypothetical protein